VRRRIWRICVSIILAGVVSGRYALGTIGWYEWSVSDDRGTRALGSSRAFVWCIMVFFILLTGMDSSRRGGCMYD
jgi:hypothetical protein